MNINPIKSTLSFGTKIVVQSKDEHLKEVHQKIPKHVYKHINEPMCDFWTTVTEKPAIVKSKKACRYPKTMLLKTANLKKALRKQFLGETSSIDICTAGIIIGNNGKIGMFHIAPTIENFDNLSSWSTNGDILGKSIDDFSKRNKGVKKAIILGGKKPTTERSSFSKKVNLEIRKRFEQRNIPTTILSNFKGAEFDILYSGNEDILKIAPLGMPTKLENLFGEISLQEDDLII